MDTEGTPSKVSHRTKSNVFGIHNIGNTCFFNSTMQALNATRELVDAYIEHKDEFCEEESILGSRLFDNKKPET